MSNVALVYLFDHLISPMPQFFCHFAAQTVEGTDSANCYDKVTGSSSRIE